MNGYIKKPFGNPWQRTRTSWMKIWASTGMVILALGFMVFFQSIIKNAFYVVVAPINKQLFQAGLVSSNFFHPIFNAQGLAQENSNLKEENQRLLARLILLDVTIKENALAEELQQYTQRNHLETLPAHIIGLNTDMIFIDQGSHDGILENMPVISSEKVLYGKVVTVYQNFSSVMLLSHPQSAVAAKIISTDDSKSAVSGVVKGSSNLSMYLDLVASDAVLAEGDGMVTSGQDGIFPRDLLLGKVIQATTNDAKPFQTATVNPMIDLGKTDTLFIVTNYKK